MKRRQFITGTSVALGATLLTEATASPTHPSVDGPKCPQPTSLVFTTTPARIDLKDIHSLVEGICGEDTGAWFAIDWLVTNITAQLSAASTLCINLAYPTPNPRILADLEFAPNNIKLRTTSGINSEIYLCDFRAAIVFREPSKKIGSKGRIYSRTWLSWNPVKVKLDSVDARPGELRFYLLAADPTSADYPCVNQDTQVETNTTVFTDNNFSSPDDPEFWNVVAGIRFSTAPMNILDNLVSSLPVLSLVDAMRQFAIAVPMQFTFTGGLCVVHGPSAAAALPICGAMGGTIVKSTVSPPTTKPQMSSPPLETGFNLTFNHTVSPVSRFEFESFPLFGYYLPFKKTFQLLAESLVGPGVLAVDGGTAAIFKWDYFAAARPKSARLTVLASNTTTPNLPTLCLTLDAPLQVRGGASVSMHVGCVDVPLAQSIVKGDVDPSKFTMKFALVDTGEGPAIVVTTDYDCKVDVTFSGPPLIDIVLNVVMASFGNRLIGTELRKIVNRLSFKLVDLSSLGYMPQPGSYVVAPGAIWKIAQSLSNTGALLGLAQHAKG
jgi:hypothetical protein